MVFSENLYILSKGENELALAYMLPHWPHLFLRPVDHTTEGWGGPYGYCFTGNRGDILGTAIIYCFIFLYLMAMYPPYGFSGKKTTE